MKKQYYSSVYADENQVQIGVTDAEMNSFLSKLQVSKTTALQNFISKPFMGVKSNETQIFFGLKYNTFTNWSRMEKTHRIYVHGHKGTMNLKRATSFQEIYVTKEEDVTGTGFFNLVFGTDYLKESEYRELSSPQVQQRLDEAAVSPQTGKVEPAVYDKDLVCRIAERLWAAQLENTKSRLVILLPQSQIYEKSRSLIFQLYSLLPQRLRLNMGFAIDCSMEDLRYLTVDCDLPVHVITMQREQYDTLTASDLAAVNSNPLVFIDASDPYDGRTDEDRYDALMRISGSVDSTTDALLAYAEKRVLEDGSREVSFRNLEEIYGLYNSNQLFWWRRQDLERPEDVMQAYQDQQELMQDDILYKEAITAFYTELLPQKNYALALNEILLNDSYPNREAILNFFAADLGYGKILAASNTISQRILDTAKVQSEMALSEQRQQYEDQITDLELSHSRELQTQKTQYQVAMQSNQAELDELRAGKENFEEERRQIIEQCQQEMAELQQSFDAARNNSDGLEGRNRELSDENLRLRAQVENLMSGDSMKEISQLRDSVDAQAQTIDNQNQEIDDLQEKLNKAKKQKEEAKNSSIMKTRIAFAAAGVCLVGAIVCGVLFFNANGKVSSLNNTVEAQEKTIEEKDAQIQTLEDELSDAQAEAQSVADSTVTAQPQTAEVLEPDVETTEGTETGSVDAETTEGTATDGSETETTDGVTADGVDDSQYAE